MLFSLSFQYSALLLYSLYDLYLYIAAFIQEGKLVGFKLMWSADQ